MAETSLVSRDSWILAVVTVVAIVALALSTYVWGTRSGTTGGTKGGTVNLTAGECTQLGGTIDSTASECTGTGKMCLSKTVSSTGTVSDHKACINE